MGKQAVRWAFGISLMAALCAGGIAKAQPSDHPALQTLESQIDELNRTSTLAVDDPFAVFAFVLDSLPDRVKVYPTENYYYFRFVNNGTPYSGNIRIEMDEGDKVSLHFAYYQTESEWKPDENAKQIVLGEAQDVKLEKIERLLYRISYRGKSVVFALNDLSQVKPPAGSLAPGEKFIGPIFDDSGVRFFLVYNSRLKLFLYILDETEKARETFLPVPRTDRILIGERTGFAYYRDDKLDRKILIAVYEDELRLNTHFDGPFDQLPDNFIEGETLRAAILDVRPDLKGKIDRFGRLAGGKVRYAIKPYLGYSDVSELDDFRRCARSRLHKSTYYDCFTVEKSGASDSKR
jgi:hypothetical protein